MNVEKNEFHQEIFSGERSLYQAKNLKIYDCTFQNGESPLKESRDIEIFNSFFKWRYPIWYSQNFKIINSFFNVDTRAGFWYAKNILVEDSIIDSPKNFRRSENLEIKNVTMKNAEETFWHCKNIFLENVTANGDYFAMNSENLKIKNLTLNGHYSFDGVKNVEIRDSKFITKDCFWNSENVTVYDSLIIGEYLGWNAKNLTLINCTIESLQGLCYVENLVMKNCKLLNTTLAFEYSTVDAEITNKIDSVMNPSGGIIKAEKIDELILENDKVDVTKTKIICKEA